MSKREGFLYNKMLDRDLIRRVIIEGSKGKRSRRDVRRVMNDVDGYTNKIYDLVNNGAFVPSLPRIIKIHDKSSGKEREIGVVPYYPDGIMHRLITEVLKPVMMRGMYAHSCASIPGRGNMHAIKYVKKALRRKRYSKYCAKMDIRQYYPSLDQERVIDALRRKVKDKKLLELVHTIITTGDQKGLTIGYYLNQWLANYYLEPLDHMITALVGVHFYVRNMDDIVLIGNNKKQLHRAVREIGRKLSEMGLSLKADWQVFRIDARGIDFVGYRFFHGYTKLRRRNFLKLTRQCRTVMRKIEQNKAISSRSAAGLVSRVGQLRHCSGMNIQKRYFSGIGMKLLKGIVRKQNRRAIKTCRKR